MVMGAGVEKEEKEKFWTRLIGNNDHKWKIDNF